MLTSDPQGAVYTDTNYDSLGRVSTVSNPYRTGTDATTSSGTTTYGYDALNRKTSVTYPDNSVLTTAYCDPSTLVTDPTGKWRRSRVDGLGRLVEVDEPNAVGASVNSNGCPGTTDPIVVTSYTLDPLGNLTQVVQNGGHSRTFTYDSISRMLCSSNPENSSASCPAFGGVLPSSGAVIYAYNPDGTVLSKKDVRTITASYTWDALHRQTAISYSNGDAGIAYTYDQANCLSLSACQNIGHRTSMTDGAGSELWAYLVDKTNLRSIHREQRTNNSSPNNITKTTTYTFDLAGNTTQLAYPTGRTVNYTFDSADRPSKAVDASNGVTYVADWETPPTGTSCTATAVCYTPQGSVYAMSWGQTSTFTGINFLEKFNNRLQPNEITASSMAGNAIDITYNFVDPISLHNAGVVYGITNNLNSARSQLFTYDQLNRISSAGTSATTGAYCWGYQFSYDPYGNLLSQAGWTPTYNGCTETTMGAVTADANNHLSGFTYDNSGNTLGDGVYTYTFDAESQLKTANGITYSYDGDGRRTAKVGTKLYWYGSGGEILSETDAAGTTQNEYIFFGGKRVAVQRTGLGALYYAEDLLGSSRVILQNTGTLCYDADFTPFGAERAYTNTCAQNYKFQGKERDTETQNDDFGAREYSWRFGRMLTSDWSSVPVAVPYANVSNPQTLNLYAMASDDPESFADLNGHTAGINGEGMWLSPRTIMPHAVDVSDSSGDVQAGSTYSGFVVVDGEIQLMMGGQLMAQNTTPAQDTAPAQTFGRQPDGSYIAPTGPGSEISRIDAAADAGTPVDLVGTGNEKGECVALTHQLTGVPDNTRLWHAGEPVVFPNGKLNPDVKPGTAVATFDAKGNYPRGDVPKNSGTILGPGVAAGKGSIRLMDQWKAHPPNPANPPQSRDVRFYADPTANVSNNSNAYYVILVR